MLPGSIVPPPPPPPVLIGSPFVPSPLPSDPHSSSLSSSIAIIIVILITTITVTTCIVILRRGCHRRRLSCSSLSPRRSFSPSPMASVYSSSAELGVRSSASKDSGTASATSSVVTHSAEGKVKGDDLVASSPVSAVVKMGGVDTLVPSAPSLPAVELLILELLSLPAVPLPGRSTQCIICEREFLPTDVLLSLPVCSHVFHQSCIVKWLRFTTPSCCPFCYASITVPSPDKTKIIPTFCSDEYDIESQILVPSPPGEEVARTVGGYHGWLRSSLDRLSGSWRACSSNHATAAVVPVSSRRTTGSPSHGLSGRLGNCLDCANTQKPVPVPAREEIPEAVRGSLGWLRSLVTLSGSWSGNSSSSSAEMELPVTSKHVTETLASSGNSTDSWSSRWDIEAATPTPQRTSFYEYARWFFRSSG